MQDAGTREMDLADLMDAAGTLYIRNIALFLAVYAIPLIIAAALNVAGHGLGFIGGLIGIIGLAALINVITARIEGRPMGIAEAFTSLSPGTYLRFLAAQILYGLAVVLGLILLIIPGIYLLVRWVFVPVAVVARGAGIGGAFAESSRLVKGNWWRIFLYGLVLFFMYIVLEGVALALRGGLGVLIVAAVQLLATPFLYAILIDMYINLRAIKGQEAPRRFV